MRNKTLAAITCSTIRRDLKNRFPNQKFGLTSNHSINGDDSVYIRGYNLRPSVAKDVKKVISKYQTGVKNNTTNIYEPINKDDTIPQVKFIHLENEITEDMKEKIIGYLNDKAIVNKDDTIPFKDMPDNYAPYLINKVFSEENSPFWNNAKKVLDNKVISQKSNYVCMFNGFWRVIHEGKLCYNSWDTKEKAEKYLQRFSNTLEKPNYLNDTMRFLTPPNR